MSFGLVTCRSFDKDHIDSAIMKKIQTYTVQPDFQPEKIEKASHISTPCLTAAVTDCCINREW